MREVKFRALARLNSGEREWFYYTTTTGSAVVGIGDGVQEWIVKDSQFTGLKDKNGKEIYEGDIIDSKLYDGTRKNYEVKFEMGSFMVGLTELGKWVDDVIIIGNIYENPEILGGQSNEHY